MHDGDTGHCHSRATQIPVNTVNALREVTSRLDRLLELLLDEVAPPNSRAFSRSSQSFASAQVKNPLQ